MTAPRALPRPSLGDHLRVLWLLVATVAGIVPFLLWSLASPVLGPLARRRLRRLLAAGPPTTEEPPAPDPAAWDGRTVFVVAGETSGDRLAARVVEAIRRRAPGVRVRGYGGPALAAAGAALDRSIVEHAVMGFVPVVLSLGRWWRLCAEASAVLRCDPPDLLLTVDYPGLNLRLARWARRRGVRTVHLVAPQTWAWAPYRTARVRRAVSHLLVLFPFEPAVFRACGVRTSYVGHPLFEAPLPPPASPEALPAAPVVELRPGSRVHDVRRHAPLVLEAARLVRAEVPSARFVARLAGEAGRAAFEAAIARAGPACPAVEVRVGAGRPADGVAAALTSSGTSTAELAVDLVPMAVFYRMGVVGRLARPLLVTSPWIALANLLCGGPVVPERLVGRGGGAPMARDLAALLRDPARWRAVRDALRAAREGVSRDGVADRAARAVLS